MNVAPHLPGYPSPYPLRLCEDALFCLFARVFRLPFPGLRGQVVHQPVDRAAAELRAPPTAKPTTLPMPLSACATPSLPLNPSRSSIPLAFAALSVAVVAALASAGAPRQTPSYHCS